MQVLCHREEGLGKREGLVAHAPRPKGTCTRPSPPPSPHRDPLPIPSSIPTMPTASRLPHPGPAPCLSRPNVVALSSTASVSGCLSAPICSLPSACRCRCAPPRTRASRSPAWAGRVAAAPPSNAGKVAAASPPSSAGPGPRRTTSSRPATPSGPPRKSAAPAVPTSAKIRRPPTIAASPRRRPPCRSVGRTAPPCCAAVVSPPRGWPAAPSCPSPGPSPGPSAPRSRTRRPPPTNGPLPSRNLLPLLLRDQSDALPRIQT